MSQRPITTAHYIQNLQCFEENLKKIIITASTIIASKKETTSSDDEANPNIKIFDDLAKFVTDGKVMLAEINLFKLAVDLQKKHLNYESSLKHYREQESELRKLKKTTEDPDRTRLFETLETIPDPTPPSPDTSNEQPFIIDTLPEVCSPPAWKKLRISPDSTPLDNHIIVTKNSSNDSKDLKPRRKSTTVQQHPYHTHNNSTHSSTSTQTDENQKSSPKEPRYSSTPIKFNKAIEPLSSIEKLANQNGRSEIIKGLKNVSTSKKESKKSSTKGKTTDFMRTLPEPANLTFVGIQIQHLPVPNNCKGITWSDNNNGKVTLQSSKASQPLHENEKEKTNSDAKIATSSNNSTAVQKSNSINKPVAKKPPTNKKITNKSVDRSQDATTYSKSDLEGENAAPSVSQVATTKAQPAKKTEMLQNKDVFKIPLKKISTSTIKPLTNKQKDWERFKQKAESRRLKLSTAPIKKPEDSKPKEPIANTVAPEPAKNSAQSSLPATPGSVLKETFPPPVIQVPDQREKSTATAEIINLLASIDEETKASPFNFANMCNSTKNVKIAPFVPRSCLTPLPQHAKETPSVSIKSNGPTDTSHPETTNATNKPSVCVKENVNIPTVGVTRTETNASEKMNMLPSPITNVSKSSRQTIQKSKSDSALALATEPSIAKYDSTPSISKGTSQNDNGSNNSDSVIKPLPLSKTLIRNLRLQRFPNIKKRVVSFTQSLKDIETHAMSQQKLGAQLKSKLTSIVKKDKPTLRKRSKSLVIATESELSDILNRPDDVYSKIMTNKLNIQQDKPNDLDKGSDQKTCSKLSLLKTLELNNHQEFGIKTDKNLNIKPFGLANNLRSQYRSNSVKLGCRTEIVVQKTSPLTVMGQPESTLVKMSNETDKMPTNTKLFTNSEHPTEIVAQETSLKVSPEKSTELTLTNCLKQEKICNKTDKIVADTSLNQGTNSVIIECQKNVAKDTSSKFPVKIESTLNIETDRATTEKPLQLNCPNEAWQFIPSNIVDIIPKNGCAIDPPSSSTLDVDELLTMLKGPHGKVEPVSQDIIDLVVEKTLKENPLSNNPMEEKIKKRRRRNRRRNRRSYNKRFYFGYY